MKYKEFFSELTSLGHMFQAPQPDLDGHDKVTSTTDFQGTHIDVKGYNPKGLTTEQEQRIRALFEKNVPTDKKKWANAKAAAKRKFKVYPSAYANLWAAKKYKSMGGGWRKNKKS